MKPIQQALAIASIEFGFLRRDARLPWAALAVALIPALYLLIYLSSVWNPGAHTGALAVGLVNLDQGITHRGHPINVGRDVTAELRRQPRFGYQDFSDPALARQQVRAGRLAFALVIPPDFSANAVPGARAGGGQLIVYTSAGNHHESANLARRFAETLEVHVNDRLNEQRWGLVLSNAAGSQDKLARLHDGMRQLHQGAGALVRGVEQAASGAAAGRTAAAGLGDGVQQATQGMRQARESLRVLQARLPPVAELQRLDEAAQALAGGQVALGAGLRELQAGASRLRDGLEALGDEARANPLAPARLLDGLGAFDAGLAQLQGGLVSLTDAQRPLGEGAERLGTAVRSLGQGLGAFQAGLGAVVQRLPEDAPLDRLGAAAAGVAQGGTQLAQGLVALRAAAGELEGGMALLAQSLPAPTPGLEGSAEGLSHSVRPVLEVVAPVPNQGSAFAPHVMLGALWLGAAVSAFLIHVRVLPDQARHFHPLVQLGGKALLPGLLVLLQALAVFATLRWVLDIQAVHPGPLMAVLATASLSFLAMVLAATRLLGDAGKALAMVFLALQLSSSGGNLPVALSGSLFEALSPWLPMTWAIQAVKASLFGAFESAWLKPWGVLAGAGLVAVVCASRLGAWRFVRPAEMRPAVEF